MLIKYHPIDIGAQCNFGCLCCDNERSGHRRLSLEEIKNKMEAAPAGGNIEFTGGEPFIRKDILSIIEMANRKYERVKYTTNGTGFAYKDLLSEAVKRGMKIVYLKFYSIDSGVHEKITGKDFLQYVMRGIENLYELMAGYDNSINAFNASKFVVVVRIAVNSLTLKNIRETVEYISMKKFTRIILDCRKLDVFDDELLHMVRECIQISKDNGTWPVSYGLPPCILTGAEENVGEIYRLEKHVPGYILPSETCNICEIYNVCAGTPESQIANWNWKPITDAENINKLNDLKNMYSHLIWNKTD